MKSFLKMITCAAFITATSLSFGQTDERAIAKQDKATELVNKIDNKAQLTADQKTKVKELAVEYVRQVDQLRGDEKTFADKKKIVLENYKAKLKEVLTADQYANVEVMLNEMKK